MKYKYGYQIRHLKRRSLNWSKLILRRIYSLVKREYLTFMDFRQESDLDLSIFKIIFKE